MKDLFLLAAVLQVAEAAPQLFPTYTFPNLFSPKGTRQTPKSSSSRFSSKTTTQNTWPSQESYSSSGSTDLSLSYTWTISSTPAFAFTSSTRPKPTNPAQSQVPPPQLTTVAPVPTSAPVSSPPHPPPATVSAEPKGPACKNIPGDPAWPADNIWKADLPGVIQVQQKPDEPHPNYHYSARNHGDVQAAVNFAIRHNIRLSVINAGHDFLGRNDAPTGLGLSVDKLKGVFVHQDFHASLSGAREVNFAAHPIKEANVIQPDPFKQSFATFGAGVTAQELHNALEPSHLFNLGAAHGKVSVAGGWGLAGGHGPLTSSYGLGVDQVVEYQVVTPDGRLRVANAVSEPDLFWALRGGGGGTFGIVTQATVIVYPSPKITVARWWINTTESSNAIYDPAAYLHSLFPRLNAAKGIQGYYYIFPNAIQGIFLANGLDSGIGKAKVTWAPILAALSTFRGMGTAISEYTDYPSYKAFFDGAFGSLESMGGMGKRGFLSEADDHFYGMMKREDGGEDAVVESIGRHGPGEDASDMPGVDTGVAPSGIVPMDSRLLGRAALNSDKLAKALEEAMPKLKNGMLRGHLVAGSAVNLANEGTSVHPAWRKAYVHIIGTGVGVPNITSLKTLSPDMGAYVNEALWRERDWKRTFWGTNYQRLSLIKSSIDPYGVLYVSPGINADHFAVRNGRLCRKVPFVAADDMVPTGDSTYIGKHAENGNDLVVPWPRNQADADAYAKSEKEKLGAKTATSSTPQSGTATTATPVVTPIVNYPGAKDSSTTFREANKPTLNPHVPAATVPTAPPQAPPAITSPRPVQTIPTAPAVQSPKQSPQQSPQEPPQQPPQQAPPSVNASPPTPLVELPPVTAAPPALTIEIPPALASSAPPEAVIPEATAAAAAAPTPVTIAPHPPASAPSPPPDELMPLDDPSLGGNAAAARM